jgi:hypothetical protein
LAVQTKTVQNIICILQATRNAGLGGKSRAISQLILSFKEAILQELDLSNNQSLYVDMKVFCVDNALRSWGIGEHREWAMDRIHQKIYTEKHSFFIILFKY